MTTKNIYDYINFLEKHPNKPFDHYIGAMLAPHTIPTNNVFKLEHNRLLKKETLNAKRAQNRNILVFAIRQLQAKGRLKNLDVIALQSIPTIKKQSKKRSPLKEIPSKGIATTSRSNTIPNSPLFSLPTTNALYKFQPPPDIINRAKIGAEGPMEAVILAYSKMRLPENAMNELEKSVQNRGFANTFKAMPLVVQQVAWGIQKPRKQQGAFSLTHASQQPRNPKRPRSAARSSPSR